MPPKKPVAKAPVAGKPAAGRGGPVGRGGPAKRGGAAAGTGAKKPGAAAPAAGKGKPAAPAVAKPKEKVWTKEDEAARKIQTKYRQFRSKKVLEKKRLEKEQYEELMDRLEKEAFVKLVKMEQEQAEKERQKEEEERRRKREETMRKKRVLESSFDGDNDAILAVLQEVSDLDTKNGLGQDTIGRALRAKHQMAVVECEDANNNTPLSEAASGGHVESIKLLLERGADPNTVGQFQRTPLYRAAFAGHLEACQVLLQNGADPRLFASDGQTPEQIASVDAVAEMIQNWDIAETDVLLQKLDATKQQRLEEERKRREAEQSKLEQQVEEAQKDYEIMQKQLNYAYQELNKRVEEHDKAAFDGFDKPELTLQSIHDAEDELEILKLKAEKAQNKVSVARLRLREQQKGDKETMEGEDLPGLKVTVRELDDVLLRDVGNRIKDSEKWPLIIDTSGQACTFLRYRDTNYVNALSPSQMELDKVRLALLGALRFGKPMVLDMMEVDMFDTCAFMFNDIQDGLLNSIMDKSILQEEKYLGLIKKGDSTEYHKNKFNDLRLQNFKFFIVTKNAFPPEKLMEITYPIRIHIPT